MEIKNYLSKLDNTAGVNETRRAFGFLFLAVSTAIGFASVLSEIAFIRRTPSIYYVAIWTGSFGVTFVIFFAKTRSTISSIRNRMKNSVNWPTKAKTINGLCWAGPFITIPAFLHFYQFLILLGIGLGNVSTYLCMRKYSGLDSREQMVVGLISLFAIPLAIAIDSVMFAARQDIAVMISRVLISVAYGAGGIYAITYKSS
jgi:hypothetical protein